MLLIFIILLVEIFFHPRLDKLDDGDIIIWYGRQSKRRYFKI